MSEQNDRPSREKIIIMLSSGMLRRSDALNGEGELLEDDGYLFLTKKYKGVLADQIINLIVDKLTVIKIDPHKYNNPMDAGLGAFDQLQHDKDIIKEIADGNK